MTIAIIIGSVRQGSFNQHLAKLAIAQTPKEVEIVELPITGLPFYNQDLDDKLPRPVQQFKQAISQADGVLIVTPEYNRSLPGIVKNAIDWASRPDKDSVWAGKPVGIMGASNGQFGTITAQFDLRRILTHTSCLIMPQPQVYVARAQDKLSQQGTFDATTTKVVNRYMKALVEWVELNRQQTP